MTTDHRELMQRALGDAKRDTWRELASRLGIKEDHLSKIRNGRGRVGLPFLRKLAKEAGWNEARTHELLWAFFREKLERGTGWFSATAWQYREFAKLCKEAGREDKLLAYQRALIAAWDTHQQRRNGHEEEEDA